jgi:hypothetical protein
VSDLDGADGPDLASTEEELIVSVGDVGWAWASRPSTSSYNATWSWAYTSSGGDVEIERYGVGRYGVTFEGLDSQRGSAQVSAYGDNANRCKVGSWATAGAGVRVNVNCHNTGGSPADSMFTVYYGESRNIDGAYLWASSGTADHTASSTYSYNSAGGASEVDRTGTGQYTVYFRDLDHGDGHAMATAYGSDADHCKPTYWGKSGDDTRVDVRCFDSSGARSDSQFTVRYVMDGVGFYRMGYAWLDRPTTAEYTPNSRYSENREGGSITAWRTALGNYTTRFTEVSSGAAIVSSYANDASYCKLDSYVGSEDVSVEVDCYDASGDRTDTAHSVFAVDTKPPCWTECNPEGTLCRHVCA